MEEEEKAERDAWSLARRAEDAGIKEHVFEANAQTADVEMRMKEICKTNQTLGEQCRAKL